MTLLRRLNPAIVLLLLAAAVLARVALPPGWMPVAAHDGIRIELCTSNGPVFALLDSDGNVRPDTPEPARDPCPFGMAGSADLGLPPVLAAVPAAPVLAALFVPVLAAVRLAAWRALHPPATGPPAFA